jgi:hypothetical protein
MSLHDESIGASLQGLHWKTVKDYKKMLAESMLENRVLKEVNSKKW